MSGPVFAALREREVIAPDHHSISRFAPYVMIAPEERDALLDIVEAAGPVVWTGQETDDPDFVQMPREFYDRLAAALRGAENSHSQPETTG